MEVIKYFRVSLFQVASFFCVLGFLLGVLNLHFSDKTNYCVMTYMYEYPQFVRIHFKDNARYPAYGLFAYSEGRWTEKARKMRFDGIPVLFLPGNAGSHMQARSLASVALRKALSKDYDFHFDYFTISYNEELSGLYAGTLHRQVDFAAKSIIKILDLYSANKYTKSVPTHVIVIGHSMGGAIASYLLAYPETLNSTKIAIALAAPLEAPALLFDLHHDIFYRSMRYNWINYIDKDNVMEEKVLLSFGNGPRDVLVASGLTAFNYSYINALTTSVPGVWASPDHVSIVWCKQMVMVINRYLFSLVDPRKMQLVEDMEVVKEKAKHFFVANRAMTLDPTIPLGNATMVADAFWYEDNRRIYQVARPGIEKMTYLMIRLVGFPQNRFAAIEAVNVNDQDWLFGCNAKHTFNVHRYCKQATSLSKLTRWTAAANSFGKRKLATVHLHDLKKQYPDWTHVIVKVSPTKGPVTLNVDVNDHASREILVNLPSMFFSFGKRQTVIEKTEDESLYYEIVLKDFSTLPEAYLLYVEPMSICNEYHVSAELHVPWAKNYEYFHYFTHLKRSPMKIRLFKTNPNITVGELTDHVKITLLLDPRCSFSVTISTSWYLSLGQLVRNYSTLLIPYLSGIVVLAAACNVYSLWEVGNCISIHESLDAKFMKPFYVMWLVKFLFVGILCIPLLSFLLDYSSFENNELQWLMRSFLVFPAYMVALGLVNIGMAGVLCAMAFSSQLDRVIFRIFWGAGTTVGERLAHAVRKVPMVLSAVMFAAVPVSCGAASLAIGAAFYAYMISRMYQDYFEDLIYKLGAKVASKLCYLVKRKPRTNAKGEEIKWSNLKELEREALKPSRSYSHQARDVDLSNMNFHMMMFSLWMVSTLLNLPTLLAWARNFKYEKQLQADPSFASGIALSVCSGYIWQLEGPRKYLKNYKNLSILIYVIGIFVMAVGPFSLSVANFAIIDVFCAITLQQYLDYEEIIDERSFSNLYSLNDADYEENVNCECYEQYVTEPKTNEGSKNNYAVGQFASGARHQVENITRKNNENKTENNDHISTKDKEQKGKVDSVDKNSSKEDNNRKNKNENKRNNEECNSESGRSNNGGENEENGTNNSNNSSNANCNVCEESKIYSIFRNFREKLSLDE